jgi:hypothetical protein
VGNLSEGERMHIIAMLALVLVGFGLGENLTYILGLPVIGAGLYVGFGDWGKKKGAAWRQQQEGLFFLLSLGCLIFLIIGSMKNW